MDDADHLYPVIAREPFRERDAGEIAEEIEGIHRLVRDRFLRAGPSGQGNRATFGSWSVRHPSRDLVTAEGLGGRSVRIRSAEPDVTIEVGYALDVRVERDVHLSATVTRRGGEPQIRSSYSFGFGEKTYESLLQFLGLERPPVCLEWMSRKDLWQAIRKRLALDGVETNDYDGDHLGLSWKMRHPDGEISTGRLWTDDGYPSLEFYLPWGLSPLFPSFVPLWDETVREIRGRGEARRAAPLRFPNSTVPANL